MTCWRVSLLVVLLSAASLCDGNLAPHSVGGRVFSKVPSSGGVPSSRSISGVTASLQGGGSGGSGQSEVRGGGATAVKKRPTSEPSAFEVKAEEASGDGELKGDHSAKVCKDSSAAVIAKKLKNRNRMNFSRKVTHAGFGLGFAVLNQIIPRERFVAGMTIVTSTSLLVELLRYRKGFGWMNDALHFFLRGTLRKHEMEGKFTGSFYYFLGVTLSAYLYPKTAATLGICQLALADPSASYFGRQTRHIYWSRIENGLGGFGRNKGMLGFLGGALFCLPFNYRVLSIAALPTTTTRTTIATVSALLGLAGAFADLAVPTPALTVPKSIGNMKVPSWVPPFHVDDNLVVPIFSSFACTKIFQAFGFSQELELARCIIF